MCKSEYLYSINWNIVKATAKNKVKKTPLMALSLLPAIISVCAQVNVTPEESKRKVFKAGNIQG